MKALKKSTKPFFTRIRVGLAALFTFAAAPAMSRDFFNEDHNGL